MDKEIKATINPKNNEAKYLYVVAFATNYEKIEKNAQRI